MAVAFSKKPLKAFLLIDGKKYRLSDLSIERMPLPQPSDNQFIRCIPGPTTGTFTIDKRVRK